MDVGELKRQLELVRDDTRVVVVGGHAPYLKLEMLGNKVVVVIQRELRDVVVGPQTDEKKETHP